MTGAVRDMVIPRHMLVLSIVVAAAIGAVVLGIVFSRQPKIEEPCRVSAGSEPQSSLLVHSPATAVPSTEVADTLESVIPPSLEPVFNCSAGPVQRMKAVDALPGQQSSEALAAVRGLLKQRHAIAAKMTTC